MRPRRIMLHLDDADRADTTKLRARMVGLLKFHGACSAKTATSIWGEIILELNYEPAITSAPFSYFVKGRDENE